MAKISVNMELKDLEIGKWYMIESYGFSYGIKRPFLKFGIFI